MLVDQCSAYVPRVTGSGYPVLVLLFYAVPSLVLAVYPEDCDFVVKLLKCYRSQLVFDRLWL